MLSLKGVALKLKDWELSSTDWGKMRFEVEGVLFKDIKTSMIDISKVNGRSVLTVECFILNNIKASELFSASLESICNSVLSSLNVDDIIIDDACSNFISNGGLSQDFIDFDEFNDEDDEFDEASTEDDKYVDSKFDLGVKVEDVENIIPNELGYYDDMDFEYDEDDDEYDDDDDF